MKNVLSDKYKEVLCTIADELNKRHVNWTLVGSSNLRLQGIEAKESDIDIATDKEGADIFEEIFVDYMIDPVIYSTEENKFRSHFGRFKINNILVEIMGELEVYDIQHEKWIVAIQSNKVITKNLGNSIIFANSLDHELELYRARGRIDNAQLIIKNFVEKFR
ncbi:hypothetical protein JXA48_03640 [Candidatus Woesearchaeota archaeon]|nr:hypothetical protein [Candidatus Woesearchaeota archaeon]